MESPTTVANKSTSPQGFGVLADVPEDGEIVETEEDSNGTRGNKDDSVAQGSAGTLKSTSKNRLKSKHLSRPILNKLDLLQARPPSNAKNASSRKH